MDLKRNPPAKQTLKSQASSCWHKGSFNNYVDKTGAGGLEISGKFTVGHVTKGRSTTSITAMGCSNVYLLVFLAER